VSGIRFAVVTAISVADRQLGATFICYVCILACYIARTAIVLCLFTVASLLPETSQRELGAPREDQDGLWYWRVFVTEASMLVLLMNAGYGVWCACRVQDHCVLGCGVCGRMCTPRCQCVCVCVQALRQYRGYAATVLVTLVRGRCRKV
jgi:hypothetical protein